MFAFSMFSFKESVSFNRSIDCMKRILFSQLYTLIYYLLKELLSHPFSCYKYTKKMRNKQSVLQLIRRKMLNNR